MAERAGEGDPTSEPRDARPEDPATDIPRGWSYHPLGPRWTAVGSAELAAVPFARICQLIALEGRTIVSRGTGWLCAPGIIATAAHVLERADRCEVLWAGSAERHLTSSFALHPRYATERRGSEVDVARLKAVPTPGGAIGRADPGGGAVTAAGFQNGVLVRHEGPSTVVGPYLGHAADTAGGHSGGPILVGASAVALHLGTSDRTRRFLPEAQARTLATRNNSAVLLTSEAAGFLYA